VRRELPPWTAKLALRRMMDLAPPNWLLDLALSSAPMALLARRVFFHRSGWSRSEPEREAARLQRESLLPPV
jgi:hypothetical protein